ncbi:kinase-like domain-containing protein [Lipomyces kononenkoae]
MTSALAPPRLQQQQQHQQQQHQHQHQQHAPARRRKRSPNWAEFYRNGYPTDIITIDDDTPPPPKSESVGSGSSAYSSSGALRGSGSASSTSSSVSVATSISHILINNNSTSSTPREIQHGVPIHNRSMLHPSTGGICGIESQYQAGHSLVSQPKVSYFTTNHAYYAPQDNANVFDMDSRFLDSSASEMSVKRRKYADLSHSKLSVETMGSVSLNPEYSATADSNKRRRVEYVPPKKPVVKAKEVHVQAIDDPYFARHNPKVDDDDGHYIIIPDSELTTRYKITKLLGQGTFGKVVAAYDKQSRSYCAIKIIRAVQKYRDASKIELRVLQTLSMYDQYNVNRCIHLRDCFDYRNHICIVTDLLSISVFDFLKANDFAPFPASHIQRFAKQLLTSVNFLHELNLIHTDLKPENILLVDNTFDTYPYNRRGCEMRKILRDTTIHLIDFGSATFQDEYHSSVVSTRHYRAPEIILGMGWSFPCDMWSIGCILVEFLTGEALFQTHDNVEHLAMMEVVVGKPFDRTVTKAASKQAQKYNYFLRSGRLDYPNAQTTKTSKKYVRAMKSLDEIIPANDNFHRLFLDLLKRIFIYDPSQRLAARQALDHPWFRETYIDEGSNSLGII